MNYCTDLILAEAFCIFMFFHFPDSEKTENTLIVHICNAERTAVLFACYNMTKQ